MKDERNLVNQDLEFANLGDVNLKLNLKPEKADSLNDTDQGLISRKMNVINFFKKTLTSYLDITRTLFI